MKKILFSLIVILLIGTLAMAQRPSGVVYKTPTAPIIDGQIDDIWAIAKQYNIDKKFLLEEPTFGNSGTTYWKALWDDKGIYILVVANDDSWVPWWTPGSVHNWWEFDKPELYFDTNLFLEDGLGAAYTNSGHSQITPDPQEDRVDGTLISFDYHGFTVNYAYKVTDPAWNVEYFIPWSCIPDKNGNLFDKSGTMGFDVNLVDCDLGDGDGRKRAVWANVGAKSEDWNNMDDAGHLTFKDLVAIEGGYPKTYVYGEPVQLSTIINFINPGTLTYSWSPSEGLSQTDIPNPILTATTEKTYNLTVISSNGEIGKATVLIKVIPFVATAKNQTISCGNTAQLDVSTNYTGAGTLTYDWQPSDKLDNGIIKNPVATLTKSTDFTVVVTTPDGTATQKNVHVDVSKMNFQPALCLVSVDADNHNVLLWKNSVETGIQNYFIFKESLFQTDYYDLIGSVASTAESVYTDLSSNALVQSNKYKIAIKDDCGFISNQSLPHKTMHLTINKGQGHSWNLIWEPYDGFAVSSYKIYRGTSVDNLSLIGSTAASANSYSDFTAPEGDIFYQIEVLAPFSCSSLKSATLSGSRSNIASSITNSIASPFNKETFSIFPVPVHDILTINMDLSCLSEMVVSSIDGRIEMTFKQPILENSINVGSLPKGIHILKLANNDGFIIQKFTKE